MKIVLFILMIITSISCTDTSKWIKIRVNGIKPNHLNHVGDLIYFENESRGVIAGYDFKEMINQDSAAIMRLGDEFPIAYITNNGGNNWIQINFDSSIIGHFWGAYLYKDTLIFNVYSKNNYILFSKDNGKTFAALSASKDVEKIVKKYFSENINPMKNNYFFYNRERYYIKEVYKTKRALLIVCYGKEPLTDYYFVTFDDGKNWKYLQEDFGINGGKFLIEDKFLYSYRFPDGFRKLKLK